MQFLYLGYIEWEKWSFWDIYLLFLGQNNGQIFCRIQRVKVKVVSRKDYFKTQVNLNLNENLKNFLDKFSKFDIKYTAFLKEKKRNQENSIF